MISFYWGEGTYWTKDDEKNGFDKQQPLQHCTPWISLPADNSPSEGLTTSDTLTEDTGTGCLTCTCGQRMLWRKGAFHSWPIAQLSQVACPVLIPHAKEVQLNWCWFLSGEVYFASFLVTAYAKCSITSSSSTTCWQLSVSTQAGHSALMWGSIHLPQHEVKYSQTLTQRGAGFWGFAALLLLLLY